MLLSSLSSLSGDASQLAVHDHDCYASSELITAMLLSLLVGLWSSPCFRFACEHERVLGDAFQLAIGSRAGSLAAHRPYRAAFMTASVYVTGKTAEPRHDP